MPKTGSLKSRLAAIQRLYWIHYSRYSDDDAIATACAAGAVAVVISM